jgi:Txe/YoeB family toxin of Txe-Axe toxin-antitoxin module
MVNLMKKIISDDTLESPGIQAQEIAHYKNEQVEHTNWDDYIRWQTNNQKNYNNFLRLTTQPQNNPYGIAGNPEAMKKLELQKPNRQSTQNNPFMNVPIEDYNIPQKYGKASKCGSECNANFYQSLIQSPSDALWKRHASERQFYTTPNSSVPNEQTKFAQWLYGKNFVGKSGSIYNRYGYPYTPDSLVNTGYNASVPDNAGQVENNFGTPITTPNASPWVNNPNYGYGFGGIPGGVPFQNIEASSPSYQLNPMPLFPTFPEPKF